jgi:hypothetical protein
LFFLFSALCFFLLRKFIFDDFPLQKRIEQAALSQLNQLRQKEVSLLDCLTEEEIIANATSPQHPTWDQEEFRKSPISSVFLLLKNTGAYQGMQNTVEQVCKETPPTASLSFIHLFIIYLSIYYSYSYSYSSYHHHHHHHSLTSPCPCPCPSPPPPTRPGG